MMIVNFLSAKYEEPLVKNDSAIKFYDCDIILIVYKQLYTARQKRIGLKLRKRILVEISRNLTREVVAQELINRRTGF